MYLRIHEIFYCETVAHKFPCLWLWDLHSMIWISNTNFPICDFEISTQRFRLTTMIDWMQQLWFLIGSVVCTRSPTVTPKGYRKSIDLCTGHCPLEFIKTCSRVCIYIYLRSIKTLDQMAEKKNKSAIYMNLDQSI